MGITIRDVAKAAGVSVATVSRVLNNNSRVSPETGERVKRTMKLLGFFPNSMAKNFAHQSTATVALIIDMNKSGSFSNPFFHEILEGIEKVVYSNGYYLLIANESTMINNETALDRLILEKRVDGLMLPSSVLSNPLIQKISINHFPAVVIGEPEIKADIDWVDIDNTLAGEQAAGHLLKNSYRKIAFIGGDPHDLFYKNRLIGYQRVLAKNGMKFEPNLVIPGEDSRETGGEFMKEILLSNRGVDSAIFNSAITAFGAMQVLQEAGLSIPQDFGIICFDDYPLADLAVPPLTTIAIDLRELGARIAACLLNLLNQPKSNWEHTLVSTKVIARKSSIRV